MTMLTTTLDEKRLGLLREVVPQSTTVALCQIRTFQALKSAIDALWMRRTRVK